MPGEAFEILRYYRSEIKFESEQLNARVSALLSSQSFLIIAYVTSSVGLREASPPLLFLLLPTSLALLGLLLALKTRAGIRVAARVLVAWREKQERLVASDSKLAYGFDLTVRISKDPYEPLRRGTHFAVQAPTVFLVAWCFFASMPVVKILMLLR